MPNQYKPLRMSVPAQWESSADNENEAPDDDIREPFTLYYNLGMNDKDICLHMADHYDADIYGLRCVNQADISVP
jgi:hypothetical protein